MAKKNTAALVQDNQAPERKLELSAPVAEKYKLTGVKPGRYHFPGYGEIDLTTLTLATADHLVKRGFCYLVLKNKQAADQDASETL